MDTTQTSTTWWLPAWVALLAFACPTFSHAQTVPAKPAKREKAKPKPKAKPTSKAKKKPSARPAADDEPMDLGEDPPPKKPAKGSKSSNGTKTSKKAKAKSGKKPASKRPSESDTLLLPRVNVIGRRPSELDSVPGSADVVTKKELDADMNLNATEALRKVSGVHIYGEDSGGLRLNIGIRGLDPVRSRKILILEDGIPISMAPYGEPEMYYTPKIERMQRLEVVKGSGSILWGPQTIGGVINFITLDPPKELQVKAEARYGRFNYFFAQASVGDTIGNFGYLLQVLHHRYDGFRNLNLASTDINGKMVIRLTKSSILGIKLQFYDEYSHATYLGLTTPQYLNDPSQNHAINDRFPIRRYGLSINHKQLLGKAGYFHTTLYAHTISRFWQRQDYDRSGSGNLYDRIVNGRNQSVLDAPADGESIFFRRSTGNRNRAFTVAGVESRYTIEFKTGPVENEIIAGVRFHYERGDEKYIIGENATSATGTIRDDENRTTWAMATYLQYTLMFLDRKLKIVPGFRFELMSPIRHLARTRVLLEDGSREIRDTEIRENSLMYAPIPGVGISYEVVKGLNLFAGVHRGFAPPRTKDSITADGEDLELDPEYSWNYELGLRVRLDNYFLAQAAGFVMDFQNQVIPPSESSGAVATDPNNAGKSVVNAGQSLHAGMEVSATFDLPALLQGGFNLPLSVSYTWVPVARFSDAGSKYFGNRLPYSPEHMLSATLRFFHRIGFSASISANYVSAQYSDKGNSITPSVDGLTGEIEGRFLLHARIGYTFRRGKRSIGFFVSGKNLTNQMYISTRRPQGIQPGEPLQVLGGIHGSL